MELNDTLTWPDMRKRFILCYLSSSLLLQIAVLPHSLHTGHQILYLCRLAHTPLEYAGQHDTVGESQTYISSIYSLK